MERKVFKGILVDNLSELEAGTECFFTLQEPALLNEVVGDLFTTFVVIAIDQDGSEAGSLLYGYDTSGIDVTVSEVTNIDPAYFKQVLRLLLLDSRIPLAGLVNPDQFQLLESQVTW
jgi:hypothetical protein